MRHAECVMLNALAGIIPYSHLGRIREGGRELKEGSYEDSDVLRVAMPRGSVYVPHVRGASMHAVGKRSHVLSLRMGRLIFTGGLIHAGGENVTQAIRKSVLTGYQLGWLRPENKFHAYKPLHDALINGLFSVRDSDRTTIAFH